MAGKRILLIEPGYKNKYPPLGLMKLAQYHGPYGKGDFVRFIKGEDRSILDHAWDRIYVTTLFSFEYRKIAETIDFAIIAARGQASRVFVGGIAASLMHERFTSEDRWSGVRFIKGLLGESPADSLQLDRFSEELYSDDLDGLPIEDLVPDYSILQHIDYTYPVNDAYFLYASRGCIRSCSFCGVPKLEGKQRDTYSLTSTVNAIERMYGVKKDLVLMDNNVVASPRFREIINEIVNLGFGSGATLHRNGRAIQRRVDFNQGVDARILCKDDSYLKLLATIAISPLRIAFDHWGLRDQYEISVRTAAKFGLISLSNYMLYNFHDDPRDLYKRMELNVRLNEELGIRIWSFPMRYQPTNFPDRSFVGDRWSRYQLRSMQLILQATHGVVSGSPEFFRHAFGKDQQEFLDLLGMPHHFIFNRRWYSDGPGAETLDDFKRQWRTLSEHSRGLLLNILSQLDPSKFSQAPELTASQPIKRILKFYKAPAKAYEMDIWAKSRLGAKSMRLPDDEHIEDAGLDASDDSFATFGAA